MSDHSDNSSTQPFYSLLPPRNTPTPPSMPTYPDPSMFLQQPIIPVQNNINFYAGPVFLFNSYTGIVDSYLSGDLINFNPLATDLTENVSQNFISGEVQLSDQHIQNHINTENFEEETQSSSSKTTTNSSMNIPKRRPSQKRKERITLEPRVYDVYLRNIKILQNSGNEIRCPVPGCKYVGNRKDNLIRHFKSIHGKRKNDMVDDYLKCPHCSYKCLRPDNLANHIRNKHTKKEGENSQH